MKDKKKILAIIPCRAESKRLKNKNILPINGVNLDGEYETQEMYDWTLDAVLDSELVDDIVISTDIKQILNRSFVAVKRPKKYCGDKSPLDDTLRYVVEEKRKEGKEFDYIVMTHCNIPIRKGGEIDKLIRIALENPEATAVCSGVEVTEPPEWMFFPYYRGEKHIDLNGKVTKNTCNRYFERTYQAEQVKEFRKQDMPKRYNVTGSIQVHRVDALMAGDGSAYSYFGNKIIIVPTERKYSLEVDTIDDFRYVEYLMKSEK